MTSPASSTSMEPGLDTACPKPERTPKKPRQPIPRGEPPRVRKPMSKADKAAKHAHDYGPPGYVEWIQAQPSVASGKGPCVAAHTKGRGAKLKGHWSTLVPLTHEEHAGELHQYGVPWFEACYRISLKEKAAETVSRWFGERHDAND